MTIFALCRTEFPCGIRQNGNACIPQCPSMHLPHAGMTMVATVILPMGRAKSVLDPIPYIIYTYITCTMNARHLLTISLLLACGLAQARDIHVSVNGNDANPGTAELPYQTIGKAAHEALPGDVITVHQGTYRELVRPQRSGTKDKPIVYRSAPGERVVISGSEVTDGWTKVQNNTWKLVVPNDFWQGANPFDELIYGGWYYSDGRPNHTGWVLHHNKPMREIFSLDDVLKPMGEEPRWYAETGGNGGKVLMNIGDVWPANGKKYVSVDASVELGDQGICTGGDRALIGYLQEGSVIHYEGMDFGEGASTLFLNASTLAKRATIEMRIDEPDGELLGTCEVTCTGDWLAEKPFAINMSRPLKGKHNIRLVTHAPKQDPSIPTVIYAQFPNGTNPNDGSVEITVRPQVFYPEHTGVDYITVRGFVLQNAATNWAPPSAEQPALIGPRWAKGWTIEDNVIRNSRCAGISLGRPTFGHAHHYLRMPPKVYPMPDGGQTEEQLRDFFDNASWTQDEAGYHTVRNNHIYQCGQVGIVGCSGSSYSLIEGNEIHDINRNENFWGYENAGIKFHFGTDVVIRRNHIYRAWWGLWLDWGNQGTVVDGNIFHDNAADDLFLEVCHGPLTIANNVMLSASSIWLKSQGVALVHNLITTGINVSNDTRHTYFYEPHGTTSAGKVLNVGGDHRWYNNICLGGASLGNWARTTLALPVWYGGNVFAKGAHPAKADKTALVDNDFDPGVKLEEREDGWYLTMNVPEGWIKDIRRRAVTTELLDKAIIPQQRFTNADGSTYRLDTDMLGHKRKMSNPSPGPFEIRKAGLQDIKVWPKSIESI